jgi:hypothetical protein
MTRLVARLERRPPLETVELISSNISYRLQHQLSRPSNFSLAQSDRSAVLFVGHLSILSGSWILNPCRILCYGPTLVSRQSFLLVPLDSCVIEWEQKDKSNPSTTSSSRLMFVEEIIGRNGAFAIIAVFVPP